MLELILCDDEPVFCRNLRAILQTELDLCGISCRIAEYHSGDALIRDLTPGKDQQIFFLDIEMNGLNGMDTARIIRKQNAHAVIIFVTSHPDFVFQGYEVRALNYILKPYKKEKILSLLHSALDELNTSADTGLLIEQRSGNVRLPFGSIRYFFSEKHSVYVVTQSDTLSFYGKLNDLEASLPNCFIRIHNRYLINLKYLNAIEKNTAYLGEDTLPISRSCKQELSVAYAKYMLNERNYPTCSYT